MSSEHYLGGFPKTYNIAICIYSFLFITVILKSHQIFKEKQCQASVWFLQRDLERL